jgi:hypothetical protein
VADRTPPHDDIAERFVLGACMTKPSLVADVNLVPADFYQPVHELIWDAIVKLTGKGKPADFPQVRAHMVERGQGGKIDGGLLLHDMVSEIIAPDNVGHHAEIVADRAQRRRLIDGLVKSTQDAYESEDPAPDLVSRAEGRLAKVARADDAGMADLMNFDEFMDQPLLAEDWVIPELLDRNDRLVITGTEGAGKSIWMRQMAVCAAAGLHPFLGTNCDPKTVLFVDAENPAKIMVKTMARMRDAAKHKRRPVDPNRLWIRRRPEGLNLADPAERLWLKREAQTVNADLLCIGPAYKLYFGGKGEREEDLARQVTTALDMVRDAAGCAVILEHHSPHQGSNDKARNVRPIGSSLWLRWPEFGMGIRLADEPKAFDRRLMDVVAWRGARDERDWPKQLVATTNETAMPWTDGIYA